MASNFIDISEAAQQLGVTIGTLRRWDASGKLKSVRTLGNHQRYRIEDIEAIFNPMENPLQGNAFIYCSMVPGVVESLNRRLYKP